MITKFVIGQYNFFWTLVLKEKHYFFFLLLLVVWMIMNNLNEFEKKMGAKDIYGSRLFAHYFSSIEGQKRIFV